MNLFFRKYGEGPPLVILHGLFGSSDNWHSLARRWSHDFTVYVPDQRNHGNSPRESVMDYHEMVNDLADFFQQVGVDQANIIGHSMGGKVAMLFASTFPQKVLSLALLDIGIGQVKGKHESILRVLRSIDLEAFSNRASLELELKNSIESIAVRQFLLKNIFRKRDGRLDWKFNCEVLLDHYDELTAALNLEEAFIGSVLFLRGEHSDYLEEELSPEILRYFPLARVVTIPGAGHWIHADQPESMFKLLSDFLR